jgi:hypothetical protein
LRFIFEKPCFLEIKELLEKYAYLTIPLMLLESLQTKEVLASP